MECNKDEALRAKELAEKKMLNNDFEGARKIALKARQLFPELENISQLIAVCEVHCSAQRKVFGAEKDLYGILQVELLADETAIRKQYRKLALVLHPDKNKYPGAEAAFKLIGEANMILSDKGKRSLYDIKCREPARPALSKPENRHGNQNSYFNAQFGGHNNFTNIPSSQFSGMNHRQQPQPDSNGRPTFWTFCPFCNIKYEYYREHINKPLRCQRCSKPFIAQDLGGQGAFPGPQFVHEGMRSSNPVFNRTQSTSSQQKEFVRHANVKVNAPTSGWFGPFSGTGAQFAQRTRTDGTEVGGSSRTGMKQDGHVNRDRGKEGVTMPKVNAGKPREAGASKDKKRKRGKKMVVESSESGSDLEGNGGNRPPGKDTNHHSRKSSRQRQQVSYSEAPGDDFSLPKRSRLRKVSSETQDTQKENVSGRNTAEVPAAVDMDKEACKQKASAHVEKTAPNGMSEEKHKSKGEDVTENGENDSNPELIECPEPEFTDFDKDKEEHCFDVDQIWACYDTVDGMPRFYVHVRKIYSSKFRMRFTWLEAEPEKDLEIEWANEGLPVACGRFVRGSTEETSDRLMFSHRMVYEKGRGKNSYFISPRKGEIWAIFKDWNIKWCHEPDNHRNLKFDIVEILSDYEDGVLVSYLRKVKGFVSLFQRTILAGLAELKIPGSYLFRFSHRIPAVKLSGTEKVGVPPGCFELDPASLPGDFEQYHYSSKANMQPETGSCPQPHEEKVKPTTDSASTPKKHMNSEVKNDLDRDMLNPRRSPRGLEGGEKNQNQENANSVPFQEGGPPVANGVKNNANYATPTKNNDPICQDGDMNTTPKSFTKSSKISSSSKKSELIIHDFDIDKQNREFKVGQIWALCREGTGTHQCYTQVKNVESSPLRLHVDLLESSSIRKQSDACGSFKVLVGGTQIFPPDSFSHIVKAVVNGKNKYCIYPREHEIWALYKKQDAESDPRGECDIVEVLESSEHGIKVLFLRRLPGYKSVFRAPRTHRSADGIVVVPRADMTRFSHQIPAFLFPDGDLKGCWELDPAAVPGFTPLGSKRG